VGRSDRLDLIRVTALRDQQQAQIPRSGGSRCRAAAAGHADRPAPQALPPIASAGTVTPALAQPIPVGDGAALLARRPDVRAAERRWPPIRRASAWRRRTSIPASLGGSVGATALGGADVYRRPFALAAGAADQLVVPQPGPGAGAIAAAKADSAASLAQFDGTVLRALEETERALASYSHALEREQTLAAARDAAARAAAISVARQREGRIDFLTLLDAQRTWQAPMPISQRPSARWPSRRWTCSAPWAVAGKRLHRRALDNEGAGAWTVARPWRPPCRDKR
jgi:outer membrane protein TolC